MAGTLTDAAEGVTDEFADYMRAQAKRYLQRVRGSAHTIAQLRSEIAELDGMADGLGAVRYDAGRVSAAADGDGIARRVERIESLKAEYLDELDGHLQLRADAHRALSHVRQPWRSVLTCRYVQGVSWAEVAARTGFSEDHCKGRLHANGLLELYPFVPHDELPEAI